MAMLAFRYDNTFEGLLSAVFDAYTRKEFPEIILEPGVIPPLTVSAIREVATSRPKADRVFAGLGKRLSREGKNTVLLAFLAETEGTATHLFRYICKAFDAPPGVTVEADFTDGDILAVDQAARKVFAEHHRLLGFARFQKTADNIFFSAISPRYNVLALLLPHFMDRFASHPWVIYDAGRGFGFYHENGTISDMSLNGELLTSGMLPDRLLAEDEKAFQEIWQEYLRAATIKERMNVTLQARCLPRRFWPYMTEMRSHG
ncbi:conserved hypothetical protein [uncultured delta proteobacterium]|uniref:DUF4130 domain-containing protein n=1 Tax=uncultured delta proteobacterium TaxID=34034 RepID=A0A212IUR8_9DELT|nr:conserved hypothetical protein [uncultured delta proteobacterium]